MLKVQVISRETIKPSSPTPHHLRHFNLTKLGQAIPPMYLSLIFFYPGNGNSCSSDVGSVERSKVMRKSLPEALTCFYPLAGRIKLEDKFTVECNDEGVEFSEARVNGQLSEFLQRPYVEALNQMVPCSFFHVRSGSDALLAVQINQFECGGLAIGVGMFHKVADTASLATFMNEWACISRGTASEEAIAPDFNSATHFPINGHPIPQATYTPIENIATKRFVFDASMIAAIRDGFNTNHPEVERPTQVEAVSALIWRCIMRACGKEGSVASAAFHAVNLRHRMVTPLSERCFGNISVLVVAVAMAKECHENIQHHLERKLRIAIREVDSGYITLLQSPDGFSRHMESTYDEVVKYSDNGGMVWCLFSSWCRFPFYEVDFGWGKPIWVSTCTFPGANTIILMGTRSGDGMEAWVNMVDVDMAKFEKDQELISFVSSPSTAA